MAPLLDTLKMAEEYHGVDSAAVEDLKRFITEENSRLLTEIGLLRARLDVQFGPGRLDSSTFREDLKAALRDQLMIIGIWLAIELAVAVAIIKLLPNLA